MALNTVASPADPASGFVEAYERAGSPLGPPQSWPAALSVMVGVMLRSDQPMLIAWGEDLIALYNDAHASLIGDRHPETFGRPLFQVWNSIADLVEARFRDALKGHGSRVGGIVIPIVRGGSTVSAHFNISYNPIPDGEAIGGVLCLSTETTADVLAEQRKVALLELNERLRSQGEALQRARQSFSAIFGASSEGLTLCRLLTDASGRAIDYQVLDVNPAHRDLTGATRDQMLARPISQIAPPINPHWIDSAEKAVRSGRPQAFEVRSPVTGRWLDIRVSPVGDDLFAQTFIDVTARHEAEDQRRRLVEEMNHRVMNNFQLVAAVLELQIRRSASVEVKDALQAAVRRVQSLSELHHSLALSPESGEVDMQLYLTTICDNLRATIDDPGRIVLRVSACQARLDSAVAVPLGFVVNELVTNAIKYAFPDTARGEISVVFETNEAGGYRLVIADGGKGLPEVAQTQGTGLGMRLVRAFVTQIHGVLDVRHDGGLAYTISLPGAKDGGRS